MSAARAGARSLAAVDTLSGAADAARLLCGTFPTVVVTAGGDGVACATRDGEAFSIEAITVALVSTHGAGDAFTGVLATELAAGASMRSAIEAANRAAAILVSTPHAE